MQIAGRSTRSALGLGAGVLAAIVLCLAVIIAWETRHESTASCVGTCDPDPTAASPAATGSIESTTPSPDLALGPRTGTDGQHNSNGSLPPVGCAAGGDFARLIWCATPVPAVFAIGDSLMVASGAQGCSELQAAIPGVVDNSATGRQFSEAQPILAGASPELGDDDIIVIALGTNGPFSLDEFDQLMASEPDHRFAFVNVFVPEWWESIANETLRVGVARHGDRATVIDWRSVAAANVGLLAGDGYHLTCESARLHARTIAAGLADFVNGSFGAEPALVPMVTDDAVATTEALGDD